MYQCNFQLTDLLYILIYQTDCEINRDEKICIDIIFMVSGGKTMGIESLRGMDCYVLCKKN